MDRVAPDPSVDAPSVSAPSAGVRDPRARLILVVSSIAAVLVMGGLVALAIVDGSGSAQRSGATFGLHPSPSAGDRVPSDPVPMPVGCVPDPARPPKLVADLTEQGVDFGKVKQGQTVERRVSFRSEGEGPLCVRDVQTGCGCVKAQLEGDKRRYEPGERGVVVLVLDSTGRTGLQNKAFTIVTNELEGGRRTWPVKADISLGVIASSHVLDFGRPRKGAPATGKVRLSSPKADAPWTVSSVLAGTAVNEPPPEYSWQVVEVPDPNLRILDLSVTHPGRTRDGLWRAPVIVKLTHPDRPEVSFEGQLQLLPALLATPPMATFGYVENGVPARPIKIHLRPGVLPAQPFEVTGVRVAPLEGKQFDAGGAPFVAEQGTEADGTRYVSVSYDGKSRQPGLVLADLVVSTSLPEQPELHVALRATIAGSKTSDLK